MSKTGEILAKFAKENQELASSGLSAVENLARVANEFQTKVADGVPFELIGDIVAATLGDMVPDQAKMYINIAAFLTMLVVAMVALLLGRKLINSFFAKRTRFDEEEN